MTGGALHWPWVRCRIAAINRAFWIFKLHFYWSYLNSTHSHDSIRRATHFSLCLFLSVCSRADTPRTHIYQFIYFTNASFVLIHFNRRACSRTCGKTSTHKISKISLNSVGDRLRFGALAHTAPHTGTHAQHNYFFFNFLANSRIRTISEQLNTIFHFK